MTYIDSILFILCCGIGKNHTFVVDWKGAEELPPSTGQRGYPAMSFYSPGPAFPAVAAIVNYRSPLPAGVAAAGTAVPLPQPPPPPPPPLLPAPLPVPVPVLEPPQRTKVDGPPAPSPGPTFSSGPTPTTAGTPDPVTKAVMDNIMGKLPTKKQPTSCKCEVCGLEFSGQVVLETHLAGAKHAKKVKSQEILRQLQNSGQTFSRDEKTKILKCEVCDVVVNSSQQLQTHLAGNKHKQKVLKKVAQGSGQGKSAIGLNANNVIGSHTAMGADILSDANGNSASAPMDTSPSRDGGGGGCSPMAAAAGASGVGGAQGAKKVDGEMGVDGSGGVAAGESQCPSSLTQRASKYFCDTCNVSLNSEIQLEQHLGSRKHKERSANGGKSRPRPAPYWKKPRGPPFGNGGGGGKRAGVGAVVAAAAGPSLPFTQPLSSTFVSGGSMM